MEWDFKQALSEAMEGENVGARKLTFTEQCGAFACLYSGMRNQVVARAFGISVQTVSKLSGCLENDPDPYRVEYVKDDKTGEEISRHALRDHNRNRRVNRYRHYQEVAHEFEALGPLEFSRRYYTERVHNRTMIAKEEMRVEGRKKNPIGT